MGMPLGNGFGFQVSGLPLLSLSISPTFPSGYGFQFVASHRAGNYPINRQ
jgi:hypothetical protein